jgi:hypothetical protein
MFWEKKLKGTDFLRVYQYSFAINWSVLTFVSLLQTFANLLLTFGVKGHPSSCSEGSTPPPKKKNHGVGKQQGWPPPLLSPRRGHQMINVSCRCHYSPLPPPVCLSPANFSQFAANLCQSAANLCSGSRVAEPNLFDSAPALAPALALTFKKFRLRLRLELCGCLFSQLLNEKVDFS